MLQYIFIINNKTSFPDSVMMFYHDLYVYCNSSFLSHMPPRAPTQFVTLLTTLKQCFHCGLSMIVCPFINP